MRVRVVKWFVLGLLLLAAAGWVWHWKNRTAQTSVPPAMASASRTSSPATKPAAGAATTVATTAVPAKTNRFAYRLSNTSKSIGELAGDPQAILLANALIDTRRPINFYIPPNLRAPGDPGAYIVQSRGPITAAFRRTLAGAGADIVSYIPNNAYLVRVPATGAGALAVAAGVQAVIPYEPYFKLSPALLDLAAQAKPLPPGTALELGLFASDAAATEQRLAALGAKFLGASGQSPFGPVVRVLAPENWTALAQVPGVQLVEVSRQKVSANDLSRATVGVAVDTQTPTNYLNLTGKNVTVAVDDTGIDATHPDLTGRVLGLNANDLVDTNGHGTHVAGTIAGDGTKSTTVTNAEGSIMPATNGQFRGMAPAATLFSINRGLADATLQSVAAFTNALISNNSWNYGGDFNYDLAAASYDWATRDALPFVTGAQPVLFVFAAGDSGGGNNDGAGGSSDTILSPATAKNVLTVGALEQLRNITNIVTDANSNQSAFWLPQTDSSSQVAEYSSRGNVGVGIEGPYGRFKPDVMAPGTFVISTRSGQWDTNAYYNPTNVSVTPYTSQVVFSNAPAYYIVSVPPNAVGVVITITTNQFSNPFPPDLPIYVAQNGVPGPANNDFFMTKDGVTIPPDGPGNYLQQIQNSGFSFAVYDNTNAPVNYDLTVAILTTNNVGNLYSVLEGMNDALGGYYRYESGTSMAAADVSGVLALLADYFTNQLHETPSPALLKALLINGARSIGSYSLAFTNGVNFQGWGLINLPNSLPLTSSNLTTVPNGQTPMPLFFADQSTNNALATGDSHTYTVTIDTNNFANFLNFKATLAWTDPPGDPAAAIKLVNSLELVVTNLDTGAVYYGNDIAPGVGYNQPSDTNGPPNLDLINNVQSVILPPPLDGKYSVTVVGRQVNVNAVAEQTNNVVQDYALVVAVGEGEVPTAITSVTDNGIVSNPTGDQDMTFVTSTNTPLFNQFVGANTPLLGTNTLPLGGNTVWGPNGQVTVGMTNQWHFYIVTNNAVDQNGLTIDVTNAAFITFDPYTLSVPRMGVFADSTADATRPEADIDLYVSRDPGLLNLDPAVISNCLAGANDSRASLGQGGTEFVFYTNSAHGDVYYVGVKSEDQMASEYAFLPLFTAIPFSQLDQNGNLIVNGQLLPTAIPDGDNAHPGVTNVFALAVPLIPGMTVAKVTVTNLNEHQNFGDLFGAVSFGGRAVVLNNHDGYGNTFGTLPRVYDDSLNPVVGSQHTDGPGSLTDFRGRSAIGPWILTEMDNSLTQTGRVSAYSLLIQPHRDLKNGIIVSIPPQGWFIDFVDVTPGYTNLTFYATNLPPTVGPPPLQMFERLGNEPTLTNFDQEADLTNSPPGQPPYPNGNDPGNLISVGPPLEAGRYFVGIYNPSTVTANVFLQATLGLGAQAANTFNYTTNPATALLDDAVSSSTMFVSATNLISSVNVGLIVKTPRVSDLTFTLVSPTGQRILLMENRGGTDTNNVGDLTITTNFFGQQVSGGRATTNIVVGPVPNAGTLIVNYDFYTQPDSMDVYYDGADIYSTGLVSGTNSFSVSYGPGVATNLVIVMNQNGNPGTTNDAWIFTPTVVSADYNYLTFTDDTNLTQVPIKFAIPPFDVSASGTNFALSDFEFATNGDYLAPTNIYDPFGGWAVVTNRLLGTNQVFWTNNLVSVVSDPATAQGGSNYLALGLGSIRRDVPLTVGRKYQISFGYRGPGISGWWRGEGNASDSSDPEVNGNNGNLIGRFQFPAGEVGQAFELADQGGQFDFAGTNNYVQIPQSPALDVGQGGGFTVEGWINPTNVTRPQPLVEWLAHVPTNSAVTNLVILAGPYLNRDTDHFYYLLGATNWAVSEFWAEQLGGHLAAINTANEQNWIFDNFGDYGGTNRNLWLGLTNAGGGFGWTTGEAVLYTNWLGGQPNNCDGSHSYAFMFGQTNNQPGLWALADNNGFVCGSATSNLVYGVAEAPNLQSNGVQFWICVTNSPVTGQPLVSGSGCLYADIVDTNFVSHEIYSAPGLLQSNVYQHVALTFNTNSGLAELFLNGTNVATTNLFAANGPFVPKTDGDVLLGRDMTRATNNYYGGTLDEMSLYHRALSDAEIFAIYNVSATTTNGLTGKFDPSITPALGLAEAQASLGTMTNLVLGMNNQWQVNGFTFTADTNSLPLQITSLEPGLLLDNFTLTEAPQGNLYYLPEQALDALAGDSAYGTWTLQIWDNRIGAYVTNVNQLVSWQLSFVLASNSPVAGALQPQTPAAGTVNPGQIIYYTVPVPTWAHNATNLLISSTAPVDLLFNPSNPPTGSNPGDVVLLANSTAGIGSPVLSDNPPSTPPLTPGSTYYLGVRNNGTKVASVVVEVDFDILALTNGAPYTDVLGTNDSVRYFSYTVASNAYAATFQLLGITNGNADLVVRKGVPLPTLTSSDYGSFNVGSLDENIYVLTNSAPVPLSPGTWYLGVFKRDAGPVGYSVLAKELDTNSPPTMPAVIDLANGVPFSWTMGPGADLTNFFRFHVTNSVVNGVTNYAQGLRFELYNQDGNGDLTLETNTLPLAPPFWQSSQNLGRNDELILVFTNSVLTNLATDWYLGVPNHETRLLHYTVIASVETNAYFPAFPGATGMGGGALGAGHAGASNSVYHVIYTDDSGGFGTLRDAVSQPNRTVVFDVSGIITLQTPLIITNSYLTIAGQTAPGGGITVAGNMTAVQSAHDVVIRDVRFRPGSGCSCCEEVNAGVVWTNGFEGNGNTNYAPTAGTYFAGGWYVNSGSVDVLVAGFNGGTAYTGTHYLDLDGDNPGTISTNVATVPGQTYQLSFAYSQNPDARGYGFSNSAMQLSQNGSALLTLTLNITSNSWANLMWATTSVVFAATSPTTTLTFHSLDPALDKYGVLLDAVSLTINRTVNRGNALQFQNVSNVISDHVSAEWSTTNLVSVLNATNLTMQWSILADSLYNTNAPQGIGSLLRYGSGGLSFHHNLYADNYTGNPRLGDNVSLDFVNNVIYNWGLFSGLSGDTNDLAANPDGFTNRLNYDCNYLIAGPDTAAFATNDAITNIAFWGGTTNTWIFQTNNFIDSNVNGILDGANTQWGMFTNQYTKFGRPFPLIPVPTDEAFLAYEKVLDFAGVSMGQRDSVDTNIVGGVRSQTSRFISTSPLSGMAAWWKAENNALDSVGSNNGILMGGLGFAPGEVGQAFNFKDSNGYVFVPASSQLDVGACSGFTIEEWIKPANVSTQLPLVEWATNTVLSPFVLAGPIMNPNNGHYYYLLKTNTWAGSEVWAKQLGGNLATIRNSIENAWIFNTFANYGGTPRTLWMGLYDPTQDAGGGHANNFVWVSGETAAYRNWASGEPNNCSGNEYFCFIYSPTINTGAVWNDNDGIGTVCNQGYAVPVNGVVEITNVPPPWLWTSVAWPGGGGPGCLYANLIDATNGFHPFSSAAGLIQPNVYQHVALTYSTNSGIATLYLNGAIVASANMGTFVPRTTGNVLLGRNNDQLSTNTYSGGMDEVTIYNHALSQTEIQSIYQAGSAGKFASSFRLLPYLDTDQDGIPDFWEMTFTPNLVFVPSANHDRDGDGYSDLEEYNNWLAGPHALTVTNTPVGVDLMQLFGKIGNLSFSVTNAINGSVYLTNVLNGVTNTGPFGNSIAWFTPTNDFGSGTNYGYASFDAYVTNNDTLAWFGPVTVRVVVSKVPIRINSNMPPVITPLVSGVMDPTNYGGSDYYVFHNTNNAAGLAFIVTNIVGGPVDLAVAYNRLPSLSDYDYLSTNLPTESVVIWTNSAPVPLTNGDWYAAVVNVSPSGATVSYDIIATEYGVPLKPPVFLSPTNTDVFTNIETTLFTNQCVATDPNSPSLPLTFALVSGPSNLTVSAAGAINWTPTEAQGPSTNSVAISVSNGALSVTNTFSIIVEESNLPPVFVLTNIPEQVAVVSNLFVLTNGATDPDIPPNPLTYTLLIAPAGAAIDTNGVITWTPTLTNAGSNYLFTTVVTDTNQWAVNAKSLSATNGFYVFVAPGLSDGVSLTNTIGANGLQWFEVRVPTNALAATNKLLFATNLPVNVWFSAHVPPGLTNATLLLPNATNGLSVLTTTSAPTNIVPGGVYYLGVQNTNSLAVTFALKVDFRLAVAFPPTNTVPIASIIYTNIGGKNGFLLTWFAPSNDVFRVQWTANLPPASWNTFSNLVTYNTNAPAGPTNAQFNFFDDGSQTGGFGPMRYYRLALLLATNTLTLPAQTNFIVAVSSPVIVTNTALDSRPNAVLTYSLVGPPAGAGISTNGVITWTAGPAGLAARFVTMVTDDSVPPVTASNRFTVFVSPLPTITNVVATATNVMLSWAAPASDQFQVQWTTSLTPPINWTLFPAVVTSANGLFTFTDPNPPQQMKFYQLVLLP